MSSLRASLLARHAPHDAELTRRRHATLAAEPSTSGLAPLSDLSITPATPFFTLLWRELFVAVRPAWGALACAWLLLLGLLAADHARSTDDRLARSAAPAAMPVWSERERALVALLAPPPPPPPRAPLAQPHAAPTSFLVPRRVSCTAV